MRSYRNGATCYHYDNFLKSFAKFVDCFRNDFAVAFVAQIQKLDKETRVSLDHPSTFKDGSVLKK